MEKNQDEKRIANIPFYILSKDFIDILPGYSFYRLMPRGLYTLGEYQPITHEIFAYQNIVAIHSSMLKIAQEF